MIKTGEVLATARDASAVPSYWKARLAVRERLWDARNIPVDRKVIDCRSVATTIRTKDLHSWETDSLPPWDHPVLALPASGDFTEAALILSRAQKREGWECSQIPRASLIDQQAGAAPGDWQVSGTSRRDVVGVTRFHGESRPFDPAQKSKCKFSFMDKS